MVGVVGVAWSTVKLWHELDGGVPKILVPVEGRSRTSGSKLPTAATPQTPAR